MYGSLLATPELNPCLLEPRPYQQEAFEAVRTNLTGADNKSTLIVMATGLGKTVVIALITRACVERGGRVLILAHRGELITQAAATLERAGLHPAVEKADSFARSHYNPDVVVATVQTMQGKRLETWPRNHFALVVVDEAHHAVSDSFRKVLKHFKTAKVLGVTATPDRADEESLNSVFQSVAYEMNIWDAMTAPAPGPYLCRLKVVQCDTGIDLKGIRTTGGDFNAADLAERITPKIEALANVIRQEIIDRQTLVFTPDVGSATAMATALQSMGLSADWVSGESRDRDQKIKAYKQHKTQVLANCSLLSEGFDAPSTAAIALCRPTKSRIVYSQQVGRGTRLDPDKTDCLLIDFNFLTEKHELCRPCDLFDSTRTDTEELEIFEEILKKSPNLDLVEVVEKSRAEHKERQLLRIKARERNVKYRRVSFDPLAVADTLGLVTRGPIAPTQDPATEKQIQTLTRFGITGADKLSRHRAHTLLDVLIARSKAGLASPKQVGHLISNGVAPDTARLMTKKEAGAFFDTLWGPMKKRA